MYNDPTQQLKIMGWREDDAEIKAMLRDLDTTVLEMQEISKKITFLAGRVSGFLECGRLEKAKKVRDEIEELSNILYMMNATFEDQKRKIETASAEFRKKYLKK